MQIELWHLPILFATGLVAGFVDSIAGGGGLITLPVFLGLGFDIKSALGTSKLQSTFGCASASWHYAHGKVVDLKDCTLGFALSFSTAALGAWVVTLLHADFLRRFIPILLFAVALYVLFKPKLGAEDIHPRMPRKPFYIVFGLLLGFYDGFLGPGNGTFWTMAFMLALGFNMTRSTGYTKVMNLASNIGTLIVFIVGGHVFFIPGIAMGAGQLIGARLGARMVVKRGTKFIRPVFITMVLVLMSKILYDVYLKPLQH